MSQSYSGGGSGEAGSIWPVELKEALGGAELDRAEPLREGIYPAAWTTQKWLWASGPHPTTSGKSKPRRVAFRAFKLWPPSDTSAFSLSTLPRAPTYQLFPRQAWVSSPLLALCIAIPYAEEKKYPFLPSGDSLGRLNPPETTLAM